MSNNAWETTSETSVKVLSFKYYTLAKGMQ